MACLYKTKVFKCKYLKLSLNLKLLLYIKGGDFVCTKNIEVQLRENFIKIFKMEVGKGPAQTSIDIVKNYIVVEFKGVFTKLEKNLLNMDSGEEIIRDIRLNLKEHVFPFHVAEVEQTFQCKVIEYMSKLSVEKESLYLLYILDKNIENFISDE